MSDSNPYASPSEDSMPVVAPSGPIPLERVLARWLLVCSISAAPSFFLGLSFGADIYHVSAMVSGVLLYVLIYVFVDIKVRPRIADNALLRRSMQIGYWTRVIVSVAFPVAFAIDMGCGVISTAVVGVVPGLGASLNLGGAQSTGMTAFVAIFLTTVVQGALMHVVLFGFMGIVYAIQVAIGSFRQKSEWSEPSVQRT